MMTCHRLARRFRSALVAFALMAPFATAGDKLGLLTDTNPGSAASWSSYPFVKAGGWVYFTAGPVDNANVLRLWRTDETTGGTIQVPGSPPVVHSPTAVGDTLFFVGCDASPTVNCRIWKIDGTGHCAVVTDAGYNPYPLVAFHGALFYRAGVDTAPASAQGLWTVDSTGVHLLATFRYLGEYFTAMGDRLYFVGDGPLWRTDGTSGGTVQAGPDNVVLTSIRPIAAMKGELYFAADDLDVPEDGLELWKSDGSADGTRLVVDLFPGSSLPPSIQVNSSVPMDFVEVNGALYFSASIAHDAMGNPCGEISTSCYNAYRELWKTNGTSEGTVLLKDPDVPGPFDPRDLTAVGTALFFSADDSVAGRELWRSDGTPLGTARVKDICSRSQDDSIYPCGLWGSSAPGSSIPTDLTAFKERLYFVAWSPGHGREMLRTNAAGDDVELVGDINPFEDDPCSEWGSCVMPGSAFAFSSATFTAIDGTLFFRADDGVHGVEPWTLRSLTPEEEITGIIGEVEGLGTLKPGQGKSLVVKLEMALLALEAGDTKRATTMLEAFIHQVKAFKNAGILDAEQADGWIATAEGVIASIPG
jgi:ELWxxDGT repeat protein